MSEVLERPDCAATVFVIGQLRAPSTSALRRAVTALLLDGQRHILLDLAGLTDVDAAGIGELVHLSTMTATAGGSLQIAGAGASVRRLLEVVGVLRILEDDSTQGVEPNANVADATRDRPLRRRTT